MKRAVIFLMLLFLMPVIIASQIEMNSDFSQGETLIAKISGEFYDTIQEQNILLYRGHVRIPFDIDVVRLDDDYYVYAQLIGKEPNNYSLSLENVRYFKQSKLIDEPIKFNFTVNSETADFYVEPGFLVTDKDFSLEVTNLKDYEITIGKTETETGQSFFDILFGSSSSEGSVVFGSYETKDIDFSIDDINQTGLKMIILSSENTRYEIPVYVMVLGGQTLEKNDNKGLIFSPSDLSITMATNSDAKRIVYLYNNGNKTIENVNLSVSNSLEQYVILSLNNIDKIEENESVRVDLELISDETEGNVEGKIIAEYDSGEISVDLFLEIISDYQPLDNETEEILDPATLSLCIELGGEICSGSKVCEGESEYAKDGKCCLGICIVKKDNPFRKVFGWLIIFAVFVFVIWFFKSRYKGQKKSVDLLKIARGKK